jgi:hypothetical protein
LSNTVCFLDIDGVIVKQGTRDFLPDARAKVTALCEIYQVYFFSCWAFTDDDRRWLAEMFPKAKGARPQEARSPRRCGHCRSISPYEGPHQQGPDQGM